jgi:hypothetical protein
MTYLAIYWQRQAIINFKVQMPNGKDEGNGIPVIKHYTA